MNMGLLWVVLVFFLQDVGQSVENKQDGVRFVSVCCAAFDVQYLHLLMCSYSFHQSCYNMCCVLVPLTARWPLVAFL